MVFLHSHNLFHVFMVAPSYPISKHPELSYSQQKFRRKYTVVIKSLLKQSYDAYMVTCHTIVLSAATGSAAHHPVSCRCHYNGC
jgi:hypothetical protein